MSGGTIARKLLCALLDELGCSEVDPAEAADLIASGLELLDCDDDCEALATAFRDADWSETE